MRRLILLTSLLLLSTAWVLAQSQSSSGSESQNPSSSSDINQSDTSNSTAPQSSDTDNLGTSSQGQGSMSSSEGSMSQGQDESSGGKTVTGSSTSSEQGMGGNEAASEGSTSSSMRHGATGTVRTVSGCLSQENGQYTLTDKSGNAYQLTGKTATLKAHVGHTVRVRGRESSGESARANKPESMSGGEGGQTLSVMSVQHISSNCKTGSRSGSHSGHPGMSEPGTSGSSTSGY